MFPASYEPFFRAICATPADDAPRLVFADWLDEHDAHEPAAFIRGQIELYHAKKANAVTEELIERLRPLRELAEIVWRPQLPRLRGVSWHRYWRGFVSGADFHSARWFFKQSADAFESVPLQFTRIHGLRRAHAEKFAACTQLLRLEGLTLLDGAIHLDDRGWRTITQSPNLRNLRALHIHGPRIAYRTRLLPEITERAAKWLVESDMLANLDELFVGGHLETATIELFKQRFGTGFKHQAIRY